jgi:hypothetical protein
MKKHLLSCLTLVAILNGSPAFATSSTYSTTPLFWLHSADDWPGACFNSSEASLTDRLARAAVLPRRAEVEGPVSLVGPAIAHGLPTHRPDFFASTFLAAKDRGGKKLVDADGFHVHEQADKLPQPVECPTIFEQASIAIAFFAIGLVGWVALAVAVVVLERRHS